MQINLEGQVRKVNHLQPDVILARHKLGLSPTEVPLMSAKVWLACTYLCISCDCEINPVVASHNSSKNIGVAHDLTGHNEG